MGIAAVLALLNRRRRTAMLKAQSELDERERSVVEQTDGINTLFVRNEDILGSREQLKKRGYEGRTQQLSNQALDYVDDLFIMSKEIRRVMQRNQRIGLPQSLVGSTLELIQPHALSTGYQSSQRKPLQFNRVDGLPLVLRDQVTANSDGSLPDQISMTFENVFQAFKKRGVDAGQALDTVEMCLSEVNDSLTDLQRDLEQTTVSRERTRTSGGQAITTLIYPIISSSSFHRCRKMLLRPTSNRRSTRWKLCRKPFQTARRKLDQASALASASCAGSRVSLSRA